MDRIEEGCGCLIGSPGFETVFPNGKGIIRGALTIRGLYGVVSKSMWVVFSNGERHELVAEATIPEALVLDTSQVVWEAGGENVERPVTIRVDAGPPLQVTHVISSDPRIQTRLESVREGREFILYLRPGSAVGPLNAVVQVRTSSTHSRDAIRAIFVSILGEGEAVTESPAISHP